MIEQQSSEVVQYKDRFLPQDYSQLKSFCEILAKCNCIPRNFIGKPQDIMAAVLMGHELDMRPMQSLNSIAVINGRPCIWGDMMLALCQKSQNFEDIIEELDEKRMIATCTVKRKGRTDVINSFSLDEAKAAGLLRPNTPWSTYPKRMLKMRARGFSLRDAFPDVLSGFISTEEANDIPIINVESKDVKNIKVPKVSNLKPVSPPNEGLQGIPGKSEDIAIYEKLKEKIGSKKVEAYLEMKGMDPKNNDPFLAQILKRPESFEEAVNNFNKVCEEVK